MPSRLVNVAARAAAGVLATVSMLVVTASAATAASASLDQELIYSGQSYGYAGTTFDWTGPSSAENIDLLSLTGDVMPSRSMPISSSMTDRATRIPRPPAATTTPAATRVITLPITT